MLGPDHPDVAKSLLNLAEIIDEQEYAEKAVQLTKRSLAINEAKFGKDRLHTAGSLNNLAAQYDASGQSDEAAALFRRVLKIEERALGPDHPKLVVTLSNLAVAISGQAKKSKSRAQLDEALEHFARAGDIAKEAYGPQHLKAAHVAHQMSVFLFNQYDSPGDALRVIRTSTDARVRHIIAAAGGPSGGDDDLRRQHRPALIDHLRFIGELMQRGEIEPGKAADEVFSVAQMTGTLNTAKAVGRMAARFAVGDDKLAQLIRQLQDTSDRARQIDGNLTLEVAKPPAKRDLTRESLLRKELDEIAEKARSINALLEEQFPVYHKLTQAQPLLLKDTQALLTEDEGLLFFAVGPGRTYLFIVRHDRAGMVMLQISSDELATSVSKLRAGLDTTGVESISDIPTFPTGEAFALYQKLLAPAESLLTGASHVFVVPDGALQSLPLGVLVNAEPQNAITDFTDYQQVPWLAKRHAITVLPSVASLSALRKFATPARATNPFLGIGDPLLDGHGGDRRGLQVASLLARGGGGLADPAMVKQLPALPETADELRSLAASLGASSDSLYLAENATEEQIKGMNLSDSRVIAFATHGLMAGDFEELGEPALVLTPPSQASSNDDGLLTASEVAQLKLNADWVILSACNTASPDGTPGSEGLSGLAKAFFYAGSRALLVSHWPANSDAAVKLTTRMLAMTAADPGIGRSEALRRSRLALMDDPEKPFYAHPMFWAPFVVVGEGGVAAVN